MISGHSFILQFRSVIQKPSTVVLHVCRRLLIPYDTIAPTSFKDKDVVLKCIQYIFSLNRLYGHFAQGEQKAPSSRRLV